MISNQNLREEIFKISDSDSFRQAAIKVFSYQYENNQVYREFVTNLGSGPGNVHDISDIPFLPVELFRNHKIITGENTTEIIFESSGTTGTIPSRHFVTDAGLYQESFTKGFNLFYGPADEYVILALLPSYVERSGSSLVYMVESLISQSNDNRSGFYKDDIKGLLNTIAAAKNQKKIVLIGVTFALLDLAEQDAPDLSGVIVMETGGMKGRRREVTRDELHSVLREKFKLKDIHSEYGMTELLSQAYSSGNGVFYCPPWMKILVRDPMDPLTIHTGINITGGINIIDLANLNSCSFISTSDLGKNHDDGGFEVLGRFDNSDIRGCNLMIS